MATVSPGDALLSRTVSVELSSDAAVGQGVLVAAEAVTSDATTTAGAEPIAAVSNAFGILEGTPVWWTAASVGPDVTTAQMAFADGSTDQMSPVDGVVVLAHQISRAVAASGDGPYDVRGTLRLLDASGAVVSTVTFPEPTPAPSPLPVVPDTQPGAGPGGPPATTIPPLGSPTVSNGSSMIACPMIVGPAWAANG